MPGTPIYIGVDGGGSRCRVRVRDHTGTLIIEVAGGPANVYLDRAGAIATIRTCVHAALAEAGHEINTTGSYSIGLGLAGVSSEAIGESIAADLQDLGPALVTNDATTACLGAHAGADGGLIIAGTGSGAVLRSGNTSTLLGGRGFVMGDDGSGARLGQEALRRALRAHDGLAPASPLTESLMDTFGNDPLAVTAWGRSARSSDFGQYAPVIFEYAAGGDPVALDLVHAAAAAIVDMAEALLRRGAVRLALVGGMAAAIRPYLPAATLAALREPRFDALEGALLLAGSPLPAGAPDASEGNPA